MTFLSCMVIGLAFAIAVALLVFAAVLLGWYVPEVLEQARRARSAKKEEGASERASSVEPPEPPP